MSVESTTTITNDDYNANKTAKHKNNANEAAKEENVDK